MNIVCFLDNHLGKKSVQALDFLPFFHKGIILSNSLQCEVIHEVDHIWFSEISFLERLHSYWESCRKEKNLPGIR